MPRRQRKARILVLSLVPRFENVRLSPNRCRLLLLSFAVPSDDPLLRIEGHAPMGDRDGYLIEVCQYTQMALDRFTNAS
jgi:hypothetical protein